MTIVIHVFIFVLLSPCNPCIALSIGRTIAARLHDRFINRCYLKGETSATRLFTTPDTDKKELSAIKLPIIQIFRKNSIIDEFVCGNEMAISIKKFQSKLKSLQEDAVCDESSKNYGVSNVYSEGQLENTLSTAKEYIVLKLFRVGCKKCEMLEPIYDELARDPAYSEFQFLQADVAHIDEYKTKLKERLMAIRIRQAEIPPA
jgi:thiol-disulfide isomerase/thioredoxin